MSIRKKIFVLFLMIISLVSITSIGITSSASTGSVDSNGNYIPTGDLTRYDKITSQANAPYWVLHQGFIIDQTRIYLRIVDENDRWISDIVKIEADYYIGNNLYHVEKDKSSGSFFNFGNIFSKEGKFSNYDGGDDKYLRKKFTGNDNEKKYQDCNYYWAFNFNVREFETLYIWWNNDNGELVGASMYADGMHPKYDSNGVFLGIYDKDDNLKSGYSLSNNGLLVSPESVEVDLSKEQKQGEANSEVFDLFSGANNSINNFFNTIKIIFSIVIFAIILYFLLKIIALIVSIFKRRN